ncbi:MAG: DUF6282 family protein [Candidatus Altiarchaeota archaeon]|nr:DUF6282 family protein [Candidatus Altiarchaeota archaeon]
MEDKDITELLAKSYDMHFHIGPDILPRKYNAEELVKAEEGKIAGVAFKAHSFPTITAINAAKKNAESSVQLIGSLTLNYFMGGFNASAIYASAVMSKKYPIIVWFPTVHAENHLRKNKSKYEFPPEWVKDPSFVARKKNELRAIKVTDWNNKLFDKCERVLKMMQKMECILATGHLSWKESEVLATEALDMGLPVIITHPMQRDIKMPLKVQKKLADKGAYIEYCYIMYLDRDHPGDYPPEEQVKCMREIGADRVLLTSDGGQVRNPGPSECLHEYVKLLSKHGLEEKEFHQMLVKNPKRILAHE